jgi:hypothetical protein
MALCGNVTKLSFACLPCVITEDPVASKRATGSSTAAAAYRDSGPDWNMHRDWKTRLASISLAGSECCQWVQSGPPRRKCSLNPCAGAR